MQVSSLLIPRRSECLQPWLPSAISKAFTEGGRCADMFASKVPCKWSGKVGYENCLRKVCTPHSTAPIVQYMLREVLRMWRKEVSYMRFTCTMFVLWSGEVFAMEVFSAFGISNLWLKSSKSVISAVLFATPISGTSVYTAQWCYGSRARSCS
ncbi:hypothetical protein CB0940_07458 [Cercospora beticola]|uniref:Uncharacterized protein n=1 Tax=Cercospora beticola TaxID=122368 RepID=A0A2G5H8P6_CERBT|nr:hypothetical protein CB0940_07458 [Cercospora beticola]PIA88901.1 hypothetical protein CB0940_07458 [Cercospora beticola]